MGVITADRISSSGQKVAARMQRALSDRAGAGPGSGCPHEAAAPPHLCSWDRAEAGSAPKGHLCRDEVDVANSDCHTPFQPRHHSRGSDTGFTPMACTCLWKKFTRTTFHRLHPSSGRARKSTLCLPQHHSWSAAILKFLTQQPQELHQLY